MSGPTRAAKHGAVLVISLDFELHWGVRDVSTVADYRENLLGVRRAIPAMLDVFARYDLNATWATVGFLFCRTREELLRSLPAVRPRYQDRRLSPYEDLANIGANEAADPFHFAPSLIELIRNSRGQEIGTHTLSHYYCLEPEQDVNAYRADLEAARAIADRAGIEPRSLVFPRNQFAPEYLKACRDAGIICYRGNQNSWLYSSAIGSESAVRRIARLLDAYINVTGHHTFSADALQLPLNLPASRFLRPYSRPMRLLEPLRAQRIKAGLRYAAERDEVFHLWWHPHNFGRDLEQNIAVLTETAECFSRLRASHGMRSLNMGELAGEVLGLEVENAAEQDCAAGRAR